MMHRASNHIKRGLTLPELMVVIAIALVLAATLIPTVSSLVRNAAVRESSRTLSAYIAGARARAAELQRPVGIWLERFEDTIDTTNQITQASALLRGGPFQTLNIHLAEVPRPFNGDFANSMARVILDLPSSTARGFPVWRIQFLNCPSLTLTNIYSPMIKPDEVFQIQFEDGGEFFYARRHTVPNAQTLSPVFELVTSSIKRIPKAALAHDPLPGLDRAWGVIGVDDNGNGIIDDPSEACWPGSDDLPNYYSYSSIGPDGSPGADQVDDDRDGIDDNITELGLPNTDDRPVTRGVAFKILRSPKRSYRAPLKLSEGTAIDLGISGFGQTGRQFGVPYANNGTHTNFKPVVIVFAPTGEVSAIYVNDNMMKPDGNIFLMVGRPEQAVDPTNPQDLMTNNAGLTTNLVDQKNFWIGINHRTGSITTAENLGVDGAANIADLRYARGITTTGIGTGEQ